MKEAVRRASHGDAEAFDSSSYGSSASRAADAGRIDPDDPSHIGLAIAEMAG